MGIINFNSKKNEAAKKSEAKKAPEKVKVSNETVNKWFKITMNVVKYAQLGLVAYSGFNAFKFLNSCPGKSCLHMMNAAIGINNVNIIDTQLELIDMEDYINSVLEQQNRVNKAVGDAIDCEMQSGEKTRGYSVTNALDIERIFRALESQGIEARNVDLSDILNDTDTSDDTEEDVEE
jgi:hypothetical protein